MAEWIPLTEKIPNPDEHPRVLIYTAGYYFSGEQVFDVAAEQLNECSFSDPANQPETCRRASHWAPHPSGLLPAPRTAIVVCSPEHAPELRVALAERGIRMILAVDLQDARFHARRWGPIFHVLDGCRPAVPITRGDRTVDGTRQIADVSASIDMILAAANGDVG